MKFSKIAIQVSLLLAVTLTATGCTTTEIRTEYIKPKCEVPEMEPLPFIDEAELWLRIINDLDDKEGKRIYDDLDKGITIRDGHIYRLETMIDVLCEDPG